MREQVEIGSNKLRPANSLLLSGLKIGARRKTSEAPEVGYPELRY
jgi:hypothetical protein